MKIKFLKNCLGKKAGDTLEIKTDENGIALDMFWRRRLKEAELDGSIEIVQEKKTQKPKKSDEPEV